MAELRIKGLRVPDLADLFDALDLNNDGTLSADELGAFIEGAKLERVQRVKLLEEDSGIRAEMDAQIAELFKVFDEDGDGSISAEEIRRTLQAFGMSKTKAQCEELITAASGGRASDGLD